MATPLETLAQLDDLLSTFATDRKRGALGNGGLAFERIGWGWSAKDGNVEPRKGEWVKSIAGLHGDAKELTAYTTRIKDLVESCGRGMLYKTSWRFVSGTGIPNPLGNGLTWHRTLAVPYLPGSSVKGMVKSYVKEWVEQSAGDHVDLRRIFGSTRSGEPGPHDEEFKHGSVVFHDAIPVEPVEVVADVMTPHQWEYYRGDDGPSDTSGPTPIFFASVRNAAFQFALAPARHYVNMTNSSGRLTVAERAMDDCDQVAQWLAGALAEIGVGAKTKSGYGRMTPR